MTKDPRIDTKDERHGKPTPQGPIAKKDPGIYDEGQRDFYAHPLNAYGRCFFIEGSGQCPPVIAEEQAVLMGLSWEYLMPYAIDVVGIDVPKSVKTVTDIVPLILIGLGYK